MKLMQFSFLFFLIVLCSCTRKYERAIYSEDLAAVKSRSMLINVEDDFREVSENRKVIFSANLSLTVVNVDSTNQQIEGIAKRYKGYVNEIGTDQSIIRVKSDLLESALEDLSSLGKVRSRKLKGRDVTEGYLDFQIRLDHAEKSRNRYLELLQQAVTVDEILKIEKELERLNESIDRIKGKMNRIEHLDQYSTITIQLREKKKPGILGYIGLGLYHSVKWLFVRN